MWTTNYMQYVRRGFRDQWGFKPTGGADMEPAFETIPDGDYPMRICGRIDRVSIKDGKISCGNGDPPEEKVETAEDTLGVLERVAEAAVVISPEALADAMVDYYKRLKAGGISDNIAHSLLVEYARVISV